MTLDSHEIRLGNSYKIELGDGTYKIGLINLEDIENLLDDEIDDFYQALELDENVLLKLGFKQVTDRVFMKGDFGVELGFFNYFLIKVDSHVLRIGNNRYVHQLENLYFALTGEELKYNTKLKDVSIFFSNCYIFLSKSVVYLKIYINFEEIIKQSVYENY